MNEINLDEIRKIQVTILDEVAEFCERKNLRYFLGYGTLLGAIRHHGYIPWDDDIDIIMPRPDYEKLVDSFNNENSQFRIYSQETDVDYHLPFAKVANEKTVLHERIDVIFEIGVNIDVFPLDGFSSKESERIKDVKKIKVLRDILNLKLISIRKDRALTKNLIILLGKIFLWLVDYRTIISKIKEYAVKHSFNTSHFVGCAVWNYGHREIMNRNIFMDLTYVQFENQLYHAPKDYHKYLENLYDDYMTLPPMEERKTHHDYRAFWK